MPEQGKQLRTMEVVDYLTMGGLEYGPTVPRQGKRGGNGSTKVLIVDDDASVRRVAAMILKTRGYKVIEADSGFDGLERFAEHHGTIDLVLSDIVMPQMTGPEMIEKMLAVDPFVPVMLMTGCAMDSKLPEAIPVLPKPFTPATLLQAVSARLDRRAPALN